MNLNQHVCIIYNSSTLPKFTCRFKNNNYHITELFLSVYMVPQNKTNIPPNDNWIILGNTQRVSNFHNNKISQLISRASLNDYYLTAIKATYYMPRLNKKLTKQMVFSWRDGNNFSRYSLKFSKGCINHMFKYF